MIDPYWSIPWQDDSKICKNVLAQCCNNICKIDLAWWQINCLPLQYKHNNQLIIFPQSCLDDAGRWWCVAFVLCKEVEVKHSWTQMVYDSLSGKFAVCASLGLQKSTFFIGRNSLRPFLSISRTNIVGKKATPANFTVEKLVNLMKFHLSWTRSCLSYMDRQSLFTLTWWGFMHVRLVQASVKNGNFATNGHLQVVEASGLTVPPWDAWVAEVPWWDNVCCCWLHGVHLNKG